MICQEATNRYMCYGVSRKLFSVHYLGSFLEFQRRGLGQPHRLFMFYEKNGLPVIKSPLIKSQSRSAGLTLFAD
jgi:hypothetical protein